MTRRRLVPLLLILWLGFVGLDFLLVTHGAEGTADHAHFWAKVPGFFSLFGLSGCALLIWASKVLGARLQRDEGFYGE